jgi:Bax protein
MGRSLIHLFLTLLLVLALYVFGKTKHYFLVYKPQNIEIKNIRSHSVDSILVQNDSVIVPVNYSGQIDFRMMDMETRKEKFINYLLPAVVVIRERLLDDLHHIEFIETKIKNKDALYSNDSLFLISMMQKYRTDSLSELKKRVYPHPVSLALTQAIMESGWGTSTIARIGHNLFGVLSFSSEETRLKMKLNNSEEDIYLRTYDDVLQAVEHYYLLISRVPSYQKFRQKRWEGASAGQLVKFLDSYHESDDYIEMANSIISNNQLTRFDVASVHPAYRKFVNLYSYLTQH